MSSCHCNLINCIKCSVSQHILCNLIDCKKCEHHSINCNIIDCNKCSNNNCHINIIDRDYAKLIFYYPKYINASDYLIYSAFEYDLSKKQDYLDY